MKKKVFDRDFEFVLNSKQKNHLINKSNDLNSSGAEYIRLLIDQDMLSEELIRLNKQTMKTISQLKDVKNKLNRFQNKDT
ncbi:MAG: hypothetical protein J6B98_01205 [Bacilli bacterium]|nr:hypothetical protein [Bacilli bacterium]